MSHQRAEKKYSVDKYTKESNGIVLFLLQIGFNENNWKILVCEKLKNSLNILFTFSKKVDFFF